MDILSDVRGPAPCPLQGFAVDVYLSGDSRLFVGR